MLFTHAPPALASRLPYTRCHSLCPPEQVPTREAHLLPVPRAILRPKGVWSNAALFWGVSRWRIVYVLHVPRRWWRRVVGPVTGSVFVRATVGVDVAFWVLGQGREVGGNELFTRAWDSCQEDRGWGGATCGGSGHVHATHRKRSWRCIFFFFFCRIRV